MNKYIDLHFHSIYSEGGYSIPKLFTEAKKNNLSVLSLTDHNTITGVEEALRIGQRENIKVIPGVEIYTSFGKHNLHLLGYNFNIYCSELQKTLDKLAHQRLSDIEKSFAILRKKGFKINEKRLFDTPSRYLGFGHIIAELKKFPQNMKIIKQNLKTKEPYFFDIINKYFGPKTKSYLPETSIPIKRAIELIHHAGGLAVLAHPSQQIGWNDKLVEKLVKMGLDGLEILSPYHSWHNIEHWQNVANKLKLVITGGSDFHGPLPDAQNLVIQNQWQYFKVPYSVYTNLKPYLNRHKKNA